MAGVIAVLYAKSTENENAVSVAKIFRKNVKFKKKKKSLAAVQRFYTVSALGELFIGML